MNDFYGEVINGVNSDKILREYFTDYNYKGTIIEVGAYDPIDISNSYHFENNGWTTYCIEPNPYCIDRFNKVNRKVIPFAVSDKNDDNIEFTIITGFVHEKWMAGFSALSLDPMLVNKYPGGIKKSEKINVSTRTLNTIIEEYDIKLPIDILSLDIEGGEYQALQGFDINKYKPKVILLENHFNKNQISEYIINHGYRLDKKYQYNEYYVDINVFQQ